MSVVPSAAAAMTAITGISSMRAGTVSYTHLVSPAEEKDNGSYSVQVAFEPLDLAGTLQETLDAYLESMTGSDLGEEVSSLLSQSVDVLQTSPVFGEKTKVEIALEKEGDAFSVPEEEIQKLIEESMTDYMMPFEGVCDVPVSYTHLDVYKRQSQRKVPDFSLSWDCMLCERFRGYLQCLDGKTRHCRRRVYA